MHIRHVGIVCQNPERMLQYYQEEIGLALVSDQYERVRIIKLKDKNGAIVELLHFKSTSNNVLRSKGISHIAFTTDPEGNNIEVVTHAMDE